MNQPETIEEYEAAMYAQQSASMGREPVLFEVEDEDDSFTVIDSEH